jgi:hypothetical protein
VRVNETTARKAAGAKKHTKQMQQVKQVQPAKQASPITCPQSGKKQVKQPAVYAYSQNGRKPAIQPSTATYSQNGLLVDEVYAGLVSRSIIKRGIDILLSLVAV